MIGDHSLLNTWAIAHTALLVEGQSRLSEIIGTDAPEWELSLSTGLLTLSGVRLQCALLGFVSEEDNTWVWSWADPQMDPDAIAVRRSLPLKVFGEESGLWEFTEPSFSMAGVLDIGMSPGATLSMVASPQIMGAAIFSAPSLGGRLYTAITDPLLTIEEPTAFSTPRIISAALAYGLGNHRDIVAVYAGAHGLALEEIGDMIVVTFQDSSRLEITVDEDDHIRRMHGVLPKDPNQA